MVHRSRSGSTSPSQQASYPSRSNARPSAGILFVGGTVAVSVLVYFIRFQTVDVSSLLTVSNYANVLPKSTAIAATTSRAATQLRIAEDPPDFDAVHFVDRNQISEHDGFSASWLQSKEDFLAMHFDRLGICEDAAFRAYWHERAHKLRMTADWLDWSVEHLSRWWKVLNVFNPSDPIPYNSITQRFDQYVARGSSFQVETEPMFQHTIAVIAFLPYKSGEVPERAFNLTTSSLGATVESLRRVGFGRVVVVGMDEKAGKYAQAAFRYVSQNIEGANDNSNSPITKLGHMEVAFVQATKESAKTNFVKVNVPRATLYGLRDAFHIADIAEASDRSAEQTTHLTNWLGSTREPSFWKYVYLTEPDTILQFRPRTLPKIKQILDEGSIVVPWRFQPIPHESDVEASASKYIKGEPGLTEVMELDAHDQHDACCETYTGPKFKPGLEPYFPKCGDWWYMCGFQSGQSHDRLRPYGLVRFTQGVGIVSIASNEQGRRCAPKKHAVCTPPK